MSHLPIRPVTCRFITVIGAAAAACAISLPACAATATSATSAAHATSAIGTCAGATDLRLRIIDQGRGPAGATYYTLDFTNTSGSACSLSGYPYVEMITHGGKQLGSPAGRGLALVAPLVILAPGATAHTTLAYYGGKVSARRGCGPVARAFGLRVYVAGQKLALSAALGLHACSHSGQVYLMVTQSFRAGKG